MRPDERNVSGSVCRLLVEELVSHFLTFLRKDSTLVLSLYASCAVGFPPLEHPGNKRTTHWYSYLVRVYGYSLRPVTTLFAPYRVAEVSGPTYIFSSNS